MMTDVQVLSYYSTMTEQDVHKKLRDTAPQEAFLTNEKIALTHPKHHYTLPTFENGHLNYPYARRTMWLRVNWNTFCQLTFHLVKLVCNNRHFRQSLNKVLP